MVMLRVADSQVGEIVEGRCRIVGVREPAVEGAPYDILEIDDRLDCPSWAWLRSDHRAWAHLSPGDEVWMRCKVTEVWQSGARDVEVMEIRGLYPDVSTVPEESWLYEPGIILDLPCEMASVLVGVIDRELAAGDSRFTSAMVEQLRGLALFLGDQLEGWNKSGSEELDVRDAA